MKLLKKTLPLFIGSLLPLSALAGPNDGTLEIINNLPAGNVINVKCPGPVSVPIIPGTPLTMPYGGGPISIYAALGLSTTGTCVFSISGKEIGTAKVTLSDPQSGGHPPFNSYGYASIVVTPENGYKINNASIPVTLNGHTVVATVTR